jgi:hypothetical protein
MAKKTVLIVARTKMYGAKVCVGALSDQGENLRLMNGNCESDIASRVPFRIGEWWEIDCDPCGARIPPHLEDVSVTNAAKVGEQANLSDYLLTVTNPWRGPIQMLFDGKIQFTRNGGGYISSANVPAGATGFWIPSGPLHLDTDERDKRGYFDGMNHHHLSYVGTDEEVEVIQAGRLVRVSLARWWKPRDADPGFEERCYAQLSGWY